LGEDSAPHFLSLGGEDSTPSFPLPWGRGDSEGEKIIFS